jgi:glutamate dehydrogenase/leucine dehydrogenase
MNPPLSRRQFLELSGLAAGALALGGCADLSARTATSGKLRVAVIGLGSQGIARLKEALRCGAHVSALSDVDESLLRAAAAMLPSEAS